MEGSKYRKPLISRIFNFYLEGFKSMTVGKTLWIIILIKLFIFFFIMKIFFFPDILDSKFDNDKDKANYVRKELLKDK
ncbi:MAG: DUF4492 domain-containing protein [Muribaculaceae bacterium]|nr:DUF4492 domain-containing protein [Muribaculaceae bacterium]